jgi:preprotein translocase subunit SecD
MPHRKAIHETPREIPGTAPAGARSPAVSPPGRRGERDWSAYKGRPAAQPAPPSQAPAPAPGAPKQTPAPAPGAPNPPAPAKEADAGQGPQK